MGLGSLGGQTGLYEYNAMFPTLRIRKTLGKCACACSLPSAGTPLHMPRELSQGRRDVSSI